VTGIDWQG